MRRWKKTREGKKARGMENDKGEKDVKGREEDDRRKENEEKEKDEENEEDEAGGRRFGRMKRRRERERQGGGNRSRGIKNTRGTNSIAWSSSTPYKNYSCDFYRGFSGLRRVLLAMPLVCEAIGKFIGNPVSDHVENPISAVVGSILKLSRLVKGRF